ncbi:hypothetical protein [Hydrogenimonas sp.]|uniref:hypothetical protein n=1 Tax=Hydrogenimonas sp. TaxID=2231112 RepID=UPI002639446E|nr:hypothetical protein [Hydrogenimonas sp.]
MDEEKIARIQALYLKEINKNGVLRPGPLRKPLEKIIPSLNPERLPRADDPDFIHLLCASGGRDSHLRQIGYAAVNRDFCETLRKDFESFGVRRFVEIDAGSGYLTLLLNRLGFAGYGYTLKEHNRVFEIEESPYYKDVKKSGCLIDRDITTLVCETAPDLVLASWVPYCGGEEVVTFFENQWQRGIETPYFVLIGEERGGATASDEFFDWLEAHFDYIGYNESYLSFFGIRDNCLYYRKKGS